MSDGSDRFLIGRSGVLALSQSRRLTIQHSIIMSLHIRVSLHGLVLLQTQRTDETFLILGILHVVEYCVDEWIPHRQVKTTGWPTER